MQYNKISGKDYEGRNQAELQAVKDMKGYQSDEWITFLQARELGLKIKAGSKSVSVFRGFSKVEGKTKAGALRVDSVPLGFARVFNLDQTVKV